MEQIRTVRPGDEERLAYVQTESWKAAFREIVPAEILAECTALEPAIAMYRRLLNERFGNGYLLELDGKAHCIAWWSEARDKDSAGCAELICIHSLPENWHKGYGSAMMERVLTDVKKAGYETLVLWVFEKNTRAVRFYESFGFVPKKCTARRCDTREKSRPSGGFSDFRDYCTCKSIVMYFLVSLKESFS